MEIEPNNNWKMKKIQFMKKIHYFIWRREAEKAGEIRVDIFQLKTTLFDKKCYMKKRLYFPYLSEWDRRAYALNSNQAEAGWERAWEAQTIDAQQAAYRVGVLRRGKCKSPKENTASHMLGKPSSNNLKGYAIY